MLKAILIILFYAFIFNVKSLEVQDCGSFWTFDNVYIEGCDNDEVKCKFDMSINGILMNISFSIDTGEFGMLGEIFNDVGIVITAGPKLDLLATPTSACEVLRCPLNQNTKVNYSAIITLESWLPVLQDTLTLQWILRTEQADQIMCFAVPVRFVN